PFLSRALDGGLADLLGLSGVFESFKEEIEGVLADLNARPDVPKLSDVLREVDALMAGMLPAPLTSLSVSGGYRGADPASGSPAGELELLLDFQLVAERLDQSFGIDLGEDAENLGISLDADISLDTRLEAQLSLGLSTGSTKELFVAAGSLDLEVEAEAALGGVGINVGFLQATLDPGSVEYGGRLTLTLQDLDGDGRITRGDLQSAALGTLVDVQTGASSGGSSGLSASFGASLVPSGQASSGLRLPGGGADIDTASFELRLPTGVADVFQGAVPEVSLESTAGADTVDWLQNGGFSNITPTEVMGLLRQVLDALTAIAGSQILDTPLPFTGQTVGEVLDYATSFKTEVLDPLFASGDLRVPDIGPDGVSGVPDGVPDFSFGSIQELSERLSSALGLSIQANYDSAENQVSLALSFERAFGFGSATVGTAQQGGDGADEVQTLRLNAVDSSGFFAAGDTNTLSDTFRLAFPDADGVLEFTADIPRSASAQQIEDALEDLEGIGAGNVAVAVPDGADPGVFAIAFIGALAGTDVDPLVADATQLMGAFSVDLGTSLGELVDIETSGSFNLLATLDAGLTFVLDLDPSRAIQISPALPDTAADAVVERGAGAVDDRLQLLTVSNASGGSFSLSFGGSSSGALDVDATDAEPFPSAAALRSAIQGLGLSVDSVDRTLTLNDAVYEIRLASDPGGLLGVDPSGLEAAADNGILSGPTATFRVTLVNAELDVVERDLQGATLGSDTVAERELGSVSVTVARDAGNTTLEELREQVQLALNLALADAGLTLGFANADGELTTGALALDDAAVAADHDALSILGNDL
ncbi:MAG: hypothetical protein R3190_13185, partial [Thermoanaerobaculia bacterium]|nr:hypothetical protein [Thermoanaerobaculia bacterium]